MAVAAGKDGKITLFTSKGNNVEVAEMGTWTISGPGLNMVDHGAFGDERGRQKPGMVTPQTITFDGYQDFSTGTNNAQEKLVRFLSSGTPIYSSTGTGYSTAAPGSPSRLRLWANDDSSLDGWGYWTQSSSTTLSVKTYITGMEIGQSMDGVATISFNAAVTGGAMSFVAGGTSADLR